MAKVSYKTLHEKFMQNHNGTTALETALVIAPTAFTIILCNCFALCATSLFKQQSFLFEYLLMVLPLVLHSTLLSEHILESLGTMVTLSISLIFLFYLTSSNRKLLKWSHIMQQIDIRILITHYRGTVNLISAICILAVDFISFPRRFAKTETKGWGLMDTGVGLFVIGNGLVDPISRGHRIPIKKVIKSCIPLVTLGLLRYASVTWLDYQQHLTEYGVHWNFFFTLAVTKLSATILLSLSNFPLGWAILFNKLHSVLLLSGVSVWVLGNAPRDGFINANREGISSVIGYVCIYLYGVSLGNWLRSQEDKVQLIPRLMLLSIVLWLLAILSGPPSRRLADFSYITWILAYSTTMLSLFVVGQVTSVALGLLTNTPPYSPSILAEINLNGLVFFILANLLTGVINMSVNTMYVAPKGSTAIIITYTFLLCFTMNRLYLGRSVLKFW